MRLISSVPVSSLPFPRYLGAPDPELATEGIAKPRPCTRLSPFTLMRTKGTEVVTCA